MSDPVTSWENLQVEHVQNPPGEDSCQFEGRHTLFMSLSPRPIRYLQAQDGKRHLALYRQGDMSITPANMPIFVRWEGEENCVQIHLTTQFMQKIARETFKGDCDRFELLPNFQTRNPQLEALVMMLLTEHRQGNLNGELYADSLSNVLAVNLLRNHGGTQPQLPVYEGGLTPQQLRRILDYIDSHLDQEIKLTKLAQLLEMSQFHFSRLFKQSIGLSPYQYLIQQRVERAKLLLKKTDRLIVDIALECGFNSHSHLSKQFRQLTGMTPKAFRVS